MSIDIVAVSKKFGNFTALDQISLQIPFGELTALLGPSGCGKTTLLRIIAGLEVLDDGTDHLSRGRQNHRESPETAGRLCLSTLCSLPASERL